MLRERVENTQRGARSELQRTSIFAFAGTLRSWRIFTRVDAAARLREAALDRGLDQREGRVGVVAVLVDPVARDLGCARVAGRVEVVAVGPEKAPSRSRSRGRVSGGNGAGVKPSSTRDSQSSALNVSTESWSTRSLPSPQTTFSARPSKALTSSSPAPALTSSISVPPSMRSLSSPPLRMSGPAPPTSASGPASPSSWSLPALPLTGCRRRRCRRGCRCSRRR